MSKALIFQMIGMILGGIMIMGNLDNPTVMVFTAIIMICSYMNFQATLSPMTNILSYFMASKIDRSPAVKLYEYKRDRVCTKDDEVNNG